MHFKGILSLCGAIVAAVALVSVSGATTAKNPKIARIDVSSRAAVVHYLRSIHVNPKGAVIERGVRNYAGARCPGSRWTCASTRHTVVQIARRGGQNRFVCRSPRCVVVQLAGVSHGIYIAGRSLQSTAGPTKNNKAVCIKQTGLGASCSITQNNTTADNNAFVYEDAGKLTGLTQSASYTAAITQTATGASNSNTACVHQFINIDGSTNPSGKKGSPVTVTLEAHQSVTIKQNVTGSGSNNAVNGATSSSSGSCDSNPLTQSQTLTSTATGSSSITQNENDVVSPCGDGVPGDNSNMCLDIKQNQGIGHGVASGTNDAAFTQTSLLSAVANTPAGPVTQTQSSADTPGFNGGLVGTINQDSTGVSTASATQSETQCEDAAMSGLTGCHTAPGDADFDGAYQLTQNQYGPEGVWKFRHSPRSRRLYGHVDKGLGASSQTGGNTNDSFTIHQTSTQDNDQGTGSNQTNTVQADCLTPGSCMANQNTNINGTQSTNTQAGTNIDTTTSCTGSSCSSTCTGPTCTTFSQNGNQLTATNTDFRATGYGGMRANTGGGTVGDGTGSIHVGGISGPVTKALLYWNGPTSSSDPNSNAVVSFAGTPVTGGNIGTGDSNCWDRPDLGVAYTNTQSYVADVTSLVSGGLTNGMGTFALANFIKTDNSNTVIADINGVELVVFYNDGNTANFRNVVLWSGDDTNFTDGSWDETLTGVPYPGSGDAFLWFVVGDGQTFSDGAISVNDTEIVPAGGIFQGASAQHGPADAGGNLWDTFVTDPLPSSVLTAGSLDVTSPFVSDCLSLVAVAADMPASAPPPVIGSPTAARAERPARVNPVAPRSRGFGGGVR